MKITEQRLRQIVVEEMYLIESFLKPHKGETVPLDDKVIKAILSLTSKKKLNEEMLTEDMKQRIRSLVDKLGGGSDAIKRVATRLGLTGALVASIVAGGATGAYLADKDSVDSGDGIELQTQDDGTSFADVFGSGMDAEKFHGMDRFEKSKALWSQYDLSEAALVDAPVSSSVWSFKYKMVPSNQIDVDSVLPLAGAKAGDYYNALKDRVEQDPMTELPLLKNMVYGDVGKWSGGTGDPDQNFKASEDGSQILPPDWTVAYTLYADLMEEKTKALMDYHIDSPDSRGELYQALGVQDEAGFNKFIQDTMYRIGRPIEVQ